MRFRVFLLLTAALLAVCAACAQEVANAPAGVWKTAYICRGKMGEHLAAWTGGVDATLRMPTPIMMTGSKVRIVARGFYGQGDPILLEKMALVKGVDYSGKVIGPAYPITFAGKPDLTMPRGGNDITSDAIEIPITPGVWYVDDRYLSERYPYAYTTATGFCEAGDVLGKETMAKKVKSRTGVLLRLDVFTTDTRPLIACYGDSITFGYGVTMSTEADYPTQLGKKLDMPVLNLGVNGDLFSQAGGSVSMINGLRGVDAVVYMMGINDIYGGQLKEAQPYIKQAIQMIAQLHQGTKKVFWGTIPPAIGAGKFADDPVKERVRTEINTWIRTECKADGIIDFDQALTDPATPGKFHPDLHCGDWIHPNDAGYAKMAEAAAAVMEPKLK